MFGLSLPVLASSFGSLLVIWRATPVTWDCSRWSLTALTFASDVKTRGSNLRQTLQRKPFTASAETQRLELRRQLEMLLLTSYEEAVAADVDVVLWKVVTYQLIGEYRKRIAVVGTPHFSPSYSEPSFPVAALGGLHLTNVVLLSSPNSGAKADGPSESGSIG